MVAKHLAVIGDKANPGVVVLSIFTQVFEHTIDLMVDMGHMAVVPRLGAIEDMPWVASDEGIVLLVVSPGGEQFVPIATDRIGHLTIAVLLEGPGWWIVWWVWSVKPEDEGRSCAGRIGRKKSIACVATHVEGWVCSGLSQGRATMPFTSTP